MPTSDNPTSASLPTNPPAVWPAFALLALLAGAALVLEYGFHEGRRLVSLNALHLADAGAMAAFLALSALLAFTSAPGRTGRMVDAAVVAACFVAALLAGWGMLAAGALYIVLSQLAALIGAVIHKMGVNIERGRGGIPPVAALAGLYLVLSLGGTGLLMLPTAVNATTASFYLPESLLTATGAACLTGLPTREAGLTIFSPLGQGIILALIQAGGLGAMLFGVLGVTMVARGLGGAGKLLPPMLRDDSVTALARSAKTVTAFVLIAEAVGAVLLFPMFDTAASPTGGVSSTLAAVWQSIFHSISALCNSGYSTYAGNLATGLNEGWQQPLRSHWQVMGVIAPLIVLGSVGLPVLSEVAASIRSLLGGRSQGAMSTYSRLVLWMTAGIIVMGAAGLLLLESKSAESGIQSERYHIADQSYGRGADWPGMTVTERIPHTIFLAISARSTGYTTIHIDEVSTPGKLWLSGMTLVGGDATGAAGGMRVIIIVLLMLAAWSIIGERKDVELLRKSMSAEVLRLATAIGVMYLAVTGMVTLLLSMAMRSHKFIDLFLEAFSVCGNAGLSAGITPSLNNFSVFLLSAAMLLARIGLPLTLLALAIRLRRDPSI